MPPRSPKDRKKALRRGHVSEYLAALSLTLRGYRIVAMRYRVKSGEIDIIARKRDVVSFIEVKARATTEASVFAVDGWTQNRIRNASMFWLSSQKDAGLLSYSYDIVAVRPWRWPVHLRDAF
ncbi:YraN family protein [Rhizobium sp. TH2]|uniref:YraN family protein n=1 Tax=Rhizobium sp. TH2 TaxID=2775403 RepID=UPI00215863B7|nr:YraN family protein [Rhizobium sp. TH2]UVC08949.1 YraN family protein [Rhizobium sp. TH2]